MGIRGHRGNGGSAAHAPGQLRSRLVSRLRGTSPEVPADFDQSFLVLQTWGFLVPFVWGFSAKWLPVFLGLRPVRGRVLLLAVALNSAGVMAAMMGMDAIGWALVIRRNHGRGSGPRLRRAYTAAAQGEGAHPSFPVFVRIAYGWAIVAAGLGIWASSVMTRTASGAHRVMR